MTDQKNAIKYSKNKISMLSIYFDITHIIQLFKHQHKTDKYHFYSSHENLGSFSNTSFWNNEFMNYIEDIKHVNYTMGL